MSKRPWRCSPKETNQHAIHSAMNEINPSGVYQTEPSSLTEMWSMHNAQGKRCYRKLCLVKEIITGWCRGAGGINQHNQSQQQRHEWSEENDRVSLSLYINWVSWYWSADGVCNFSTPPELMRCSTGSLSSTVPALTVLSIVSPHVMIVS